MTNLVAAEGKFTKTAEQEATNCQIPPDAVKNMKAGHENLVKVREVPVHCRARCGTAFAGRGARHRQDAAR